MDNERINHLMTSFHIANGACDYTGEGKIVQVEGEGAVASFNCALSRLTTQKGEAAATRKIKCVGEEEEEVDEGR